MKTYEFASISYGRAIRFYDQVMDHERETEKAKAAYKLGALYKEGDAYLSQDNQQCIAWYTIAAILGNAQAQFELAQLYEGSGRENKAHDDLIRALGWYQKAAEQSYEGSEEAFSRLFEEIGEALIDAIEQVQAQAEVVVSRLTNTRRFSTGSHVSSEQTSGDALLGQTRKSKRSRLSGVY